MSGKYTTKLNTFYDFADCAKSLIDSGVTSPENLAIVGRSAGGLLVGGWYLQSFRDKFYYRSRFWTLK